MIKETLENINRKNNDVFLKGPFITIVGTKIQIENYKKIYKLTSDEIVILFNLSSDELVIEGRELKLILASSYMLVFSGVVTNINYPKRVLKN